MAGTTQWSVQNTAQAAEQPAQPAEASYGEVCQASPLGAYTPRIRLDEHTTQRINIYTYIARNAL